MRFIIFVLITILGFLTIKYAKTLVDWGGRSSWADEHLPLGSYSAWKIVGVVIIVFGILYLFGTV